MVPSLEPLKRRVPAAAAAAAAAAFTGSIRSASSASTSQHCSGALQMLGEKAHGKRARAPQAHKRIQEYIQLYTVINYVHISLKLSERKQITDVIIDV